MGPTTMGTTEHPRRRWSSLRVLTAPRLVLLAGPWVGAAVGLKLVLELLDVALLELNPLLSGLVGANVFLLGFLLAGTLADYKESERLPGELAGAIDAIADECLIVDAEQGIPEAQLCLEHLEELAGTTRAWLHHERPFDDALAGVRGLNPFFSVFAPLIQAGFTTRLKSEQASIRRVLIRMDAVRTTSFVAAGYAIAELTGVLLIVGMLITDIGAVAESLFFVGVITLLMTYVFLLIRDLDDPFKYDGGVEGAADVSLAPLEQVRLRLVAERRALTPATPVPIPG